MEFEAAEEEEGLVEALEGRESWAATAGGGSSKDIWRGGKWEPSWPLISVEEAGVGGGSGRGMAGLSLYSRGLIAVSRRGCSVCGK